MTKTTANQTRRVVTSSLGLILMLLSPAGPAVAFPAEVDLVLWVWERPTPAVIEVVLADSFDTVYLHVPPGSASDRDISGFVELAHQASVKVYALAGILPMVATVPFWWDHPRYQVSRKALLVQDVLMRCDAIAVMAYRDQLVSDDGIISLTADEIRPAGELGKQVIVTLQTAPDTLSKLTFHEEGREALAAAVASLAESWMIGRGFDGVAVHSYRSYVELAP